MLFILNLQSIPHNPHYLNRYIKFIDQCKNQIVVGYSEKHHILPSSIFPQFDSFKNNPWNKCVLTARQHFIAHYLLAKCFYGNSKHKMVKAFCLMKSFSKCNNKRYFNSKLYDYMRKEFAKTQSESQKGNNNSQHNTKWINNGVIDKKIHKHDFVETGWELGRIPTKIHKKEKTVKINKTEIMAINYYNMFINGKFSSLNDFIKFSGYPYSKPNLVNSWFRYVPDYKPSYDRKPKKSS